MIKSEMTLFHHPRVIYIGGDEKYRYAGTDGQQQGGFSQGEERGIA